MRPWLGVLWSDQLSWANGATWSRPKQYGVAVASVAAALLVREPFEPWLQGSAPYATFYLAVLVVAWFCSVGPTIFTTLLSLACAVYFFVQPPGSLWVESGADRASIVLFLLVSGAMVLLSRFASVTRRAARDAADVAHRAQTGAGAAIWDFDLDTARLQSRQLSSFLGAASGFVPTRETILDLIHPSDRERAVESIRHAIRTGEPVKSEFRVVDSKGGERWLACGGQVIKGAGGRPARIAGICVDVTDRKRVEQSRELLASIVESSLDAIVGKTLDGIIQTWNAGAQRLFGYAADEVIGKSVLLLVPPGLRDVEGQVLERLRRGEKIDHLETTRVTKDGRLLEVSMSVSPIRDHDGRIVGASNITRDVTERKRAERELARQREWFRVTLTSIGDAVITTDPSGLITFVNREAERLTAWTADQAIGKALPEVFHLVDEKSGAALPPLDLRIQGSDWPLGIRGQVALRARDGMLRPIADSLAPIRDAQGAVIGMVLVFHDITDQRRAEEIEAEQREWFETTLESIGDAVIATDVHCRITFMNPVAEHLTGWTIADARGKDCGEVFKIVNEQTRRTVESPVTRVLKDGVIVGLANHTVLIAADGKEHPIDDSGAPIRNRDGRIVGAVLVFRDIGERRAIEIERADASSERERLLQSERAARAEAERANRVKDEFVAMLSHELRTPLNAVLGWTHILQAKPGDPQVLAHGLDVIERNTRTQAQLISDLLDVSRIVSGKLRLALQPVDLRTVVQNAIETVRASAESKQVRLSARFNEVSVGPIAGDGVRLEQVVWNLLANAIKFTPAGGEVEVELVASGGMATIRVRDSGIGIKRELLPLIFDRFHQGESPLTRRHGGLGLGLAIVKQLVELHGGTVWADSDGEGQGSRFTVHLPTAAMPIAGSPALQAPAQALASRLRGASILLVEDDPDTREVIQRMLTEAEANVIAVGDAPAALATLVDASVDLVISDIGLPDVDGYELMRRIRAQPREAGGGVPAIALTAFASAEDRARALAVGFQAHVIKPVGSSELVSAAVKALDPKRAIDDSRRRS